MLIGLKRLKGVKLRLQKRDGHEMLALLHTLGDIVLVALAPGAETADRIRLFDGIPVLGSIFAGPTSYLSLFNASLILAIMVLPFITSISREIFLQTPVLHEEAALALGATRWEMIRMAVLPFGRSGIVSASMLGLGRALGETMAVAMVLSATNVVTLNLLTSQNPSTIAANIALTFPEAYALNINVLIATGLILFVVTFAVNAVARWIVSRRKEFSGAN